MSKKQKMLSPFLVFLAGILWGSMGIFVRSYDKEGLASMDIVAVRAFVTTLCMFLFMLLFKRKLLVIHWKDVWCFLGTGLLSILFFNFCYFKAITFTSLSTAAVLLYTAPAIVMVLSKFLFREKITVCKVIALSATFLGCVFVSGILGTTEALSFMGILVGLGAGLGYALYSIFSRYAMQRGYHTYTIIFYTFFFTSIGVLPFTNLLNVTKVCFSDFKSIGFSLVFGLLSTVLPYLLYTVGLKGVENARASIIASVEPVVATLIGIFFFHEKLTIHGTIGICLVLGAILLCNTAQKRE